MKSESIKRVIKTGLFYTALTVFMVYILFPFYWMLNTSLKFEGDVYKIPLRYLPLPSPRFSNYTSGWLASHLPGYFVNSILVCSAVCVTIIMVSSLAGYCLARYKFRGKGTTALMFLSTQMISGATLVLPIFIIFSYLHLIDTYLSLILTYTTRLLPFSVLLMAGFFRQIPRELEEAAAIDGCTPLQALFRITFPLALPGIVATGIYAFTISWKEFTFAAMLINSPEKATIPVGLWYMIGEESIYWARLCAGSLLSLIPAVIIFGFVQKYLVSGLSAGALKG